MSNLPCDRYYAIPLLPLTGSIIETQWGHSYFTLCSHKSASCIQTPPESNWEMVLHLQTLEHHGVHMLVTCACHIWMKPSIHKREPLGLLDSLGFLTNQIDLDSHSPIILIFELGMMLYLLVVNWTQLGYLSFNKGLPFQKFQLLVKT